MISPPLFDPSHWRRSSRGVGGLVRLFDLSLCTVVREHWPWDGEPTCWVVRKIIKSDSRTSTTVDSSAFESFLDDVFDFNHGLFIGSSLIDVDLVLNAFQYPPDNIAVSGFIELQALSFNGNFECHVGCVNRITNLDGTASHEHTGWSSLVRQIMKSMKETLP